MDALKNQVEYQYYTITAYADDALCKGKDYTGLGRHEVISDRGSRSEKGMFEWGRERKLIFYESKKVAPMLKMNLVRLSRLEVEGEYIRRAR